MFASKPNSQTALSNFNSFRPVIKKRQFNAVFTVFKQNLYKDLPERSGGSIIVCNQCRVTKNYFWKKKDFF